ncbi:hypothetical protein JOD67_006674 [Tenggerimyces flavus]|nr:hypothetical protein [Tenggerimyces flavus]
MATVAAIVSYRHAYHVVRSYGEDGVAARLVPLTVDGLIYASSMVMLHSARRGTPVPRLARWLLGLGIAATVAANAAHGLAHGLVGALVAAWPALALVGSYELLMLMVRNMGRVSAVIPDAVPEPILDTDPDIVPGPTRIALVVPQPSDPRDELEVQAESEFADELAIGRTPTIREIRSRLRVGQPRAQQARAYLSSLLADGEPA